MDKHITERKKTVGGDFLATMNPQQLAAVTAPDGPVLVLAGAGSGKTRVLTGRAYYLISEAEVTPGSILIVTFTNKAAGELRDRLIHSLGDRTEFPWAGTFHSFCARLLRQYGEGIGIGSEFSIYDTDDTEKLIGAILADNRHYRQQTTTSAIRSYISILKGGGSLSGRSAEHRIAEELLPVYNERLRLSNAVDFDDLLSLPLELFDKKPEVLNRLQKKYDHILIDEFQDTNKIQYDLTRKMAAPQNNLYVVGDDDQSIYGWRGADYRNILGFHEDYPGAKVFSLEQNYRSTQPILDVANDIIKQNNHHTLKKLWTDKDSGEKVTLRSLERSYDEANEVIGEIHQLVTCHGYSWKDCVVLFRTNALSRHFEEVLIEQSIPYSVVGGVRFYDRREVRDLLAYMRVVVNDDDEQAWRRVFKTPPKGIGDVTIRRIEAYAKKQRCGFGTAALENGTIESLKTAAKKRLDSLVKSILEARKSLSAKTLEEQAVLIFQKSGLEEYYGSMDPDESEERLANMVQLIDAARERSRIHPEYTMTDFLGEVSLVADVDEYEDRSDRITLMTLHAAKGLEFPVVFIAGIEEGLLPHRRSTETAADIDEERRLFYVGVTRAKERLYLSYSNTRYIAGMLELQEPSRFLKNIEPSHLRGWTLPVSRKDERRDLENGHESYSLLNSRPYRAGRSKRPEVPTPLIPYKIGDLVEHPDFGTGVVTAKSGAAGDLKVRVAFEGIGSKLLAVKYASLKRISES